MATNLRKFTLVWLDAYVNKTTNESIQTELRELTNQFRTFDNCSECQLFLQSNDQRLVLIVSGRLGREIVPQIHSLEQIASIYVYCLDRERNEQWAKNYSKIQRVVVTHTELIKQIIQDNQRKIIPANDKPLYMKIHQNDNSFVDCQTLIYHLLHVKGFVTGDIQVFTSDEREILNQFEEIDSSDNSLKWLTKDSSPFDLIVQALENKNIDLLYLTRFYLRDIHTQLEVQKPITAIRVYHSHLLTMDELDRLQNSIGKLISINRFFSSISQRDQALLALEQTTDLQKILFEIHADPSKEGVKPFAEIKSIDSSVIIFMLGSIFRIDALSKQDDIWICQINLLSDNDSDIRTLFEQIKRDDGENQIDLLSFANMLGRMKQYDDAEKYYQRILHDLPTDDLQRSICYVGLGTVAYMKRDYMHSLEYHRQALELRKRLLKSDDCDLADSYNCLGIVYFDQKNYHDAIEHYENGLKILERNLDENHQKVIIGLSNIALIHRTEENYIKALDFYKRIANIEKQYSSENSSELGQTYHNIGACFWCNGSYENAMKYYDLSLEIKSKTLPDKDPSIAKTLENIGLIHENKNDCDMAYKYYRKAAEIYQQTLAEDHADVQQVTENILRVSTVSNIRE